MITKRAILRFWRIRGKVPLIRTFYIRQPLVGLDYLQLISALIKYALCPIHTSVVHAIGRGELVLLCPLTCG